MSALRQSGHNADWRMITEGKNSDLGKTSILLSRCSSRFRLLALGPIGGLGRCIEYGIARGGQILELQAFG